MSEKIATIPNVPHHGGTPAEMLRDLADFLDKLDDAGENLVVNAPGHRLDGMTLESILNPGDNKREMQSDVRWLANQLDPPTGPAGYVVSIRYSALMRRARAEYGNSLVRLWVVVVLLVLGIMSTIGAWRATRGE